VFAGLGARGQQNALDVDGSATGEHACVKNLTISVRNMQQAYCIYCMMGEPSIQNCVIQGGVLVSDVASDGSEAGVMSFDRV